VEKIDRGMGMIGLQMYSKIYHKRGNSNDSSNLFLSLVSIFNIRQRCTKQARASTKIVTDK
jgi:hypothetical protein